MTSAQDYSLVSCFCGSACWGRLVWMQCMAPCDWHPLGNRIISVQHTSVLPFYFLFVHLVLESYVGPVFTKQIYPISQTLHLLSLSNNIPLQGETTVCLHTHLLMDT